MTLTAATLYECLETHTIGTGAVYKAGEIRRGDGVVQNPGSADALWIVAGSSDAAKIAQRVANGLGNFVPTSK